MSAHAETLPTPIDDRARILSIDVVRGVALLGILVMNIMTFAMPFAAYFNPTVYDAVPFEGANRWIYYVQHVVFDMKMMTLFSMLFGVGVMVYAEKIKRGSELGEVRWLWFKRMFLLLAIGMIHAYLVWEGDILVTYAVCGIVFLWWMRRLPAWAMVLIGVPMIVLPTVLFSAGGYFYHVFMELPEPPSWMGMPEDELAETRKGFAPMQEDFAPTSEQLRETEETYRGGYLTVLAQRARMSAEMQFVMIPMFMLWRGTGAMLLGAALYKWRIVTGERSTAFYALLTLAGYAIGGGLILTGLAYNESMDYQPGLMLAFGMPFNAIGSIPMAIGHMGLVILIARAMPTALIVRSLAAVGRMALTNYLAHSVIASIIFYGYGFGMYGKLDRLEQQSIVLAVWAAQLIWSPLWLARYRFGPVEWLWRSMTYGKMQPMRRRSAA